MVQVLARRLLISLLAMPCWAGVGRIVVAFFGEQLS